MRIISLLLLLLLAQISFADAKVYKCKDKEGHYTYQQLPCEVEKPNENTVKIETLSPEKIEAAKAKLDKDLKDMEAKKALESGKPLPPATQPLQVTIPMPTTNPVNVPPANTSPSTSTPPANPPKK